MMFEKEMQDPQNSNTIFKRVQGEEGISDMSAGKSETPIRRYILCVFGEDF